MTIDNDDNHDNHIKFLKKIPQNIREPQWECCIFAASKNNAPSIEARCTKVQTPTHQGARWEGPKCKI
jgi:hypothetical protein